MIGTIPRLHINFLANSALTVLLMPRYAHALLIRAVSLPKRLRGAGTAVEKPLPKSIKTERDTKNDTYRKGAA